MRKNDIRRYVVLLKYVITCIYNNPMRSVLIIITVSLVFAVVLASSALSDTMIKTTADQWRYEYGYSDIVIKPRTASESRVVNQFMVDLYDEYFDYMVKKLSFGGSVLEKDFIFHGFTLDTLLKMNNITFSEQSEVFPFTGNKIIISAKFALENDLSPADTVTADIGGSKHQFIISGICHSNGPFAYETNIYSAVIPLEKMQALLGIPGKVDAIYVSLLNKEQKSHMILRLSTIYRDSFVSETYSVEHIRLQTNRSAVPFIFMSVLLCIMAVYVIYVIFQNIVIERMPQMGIFRAMGSSKAATGMVIIAEGALFGLMGSIPGAGAGILLLSFIIRNLAKAAADQNVVLSVRPLHGVLALAASLGAGAAGSILALRKYRGVSITGLIRTEPGKDSDSGRSLSTAAFIIFVTCMIILILWRSQKGLVIYIFMVTGIMMSFLMASVYLYQNFTVLLKKSFRKKRGLLTIVSFSIQNQRGFMIAAAILSVITATYIIVETITYSNEEGNRKYFNRFGYDVELEAGDLTRGRINFIEQLPGVEKISANYYSGSVEVTGQNISLYRVHGIDTLNAGEFTKYDIKSSRSDPLKALDEDYTILLTETMGNLYGVKEDDTIILKIFSQDGVYREIPYRIVGFFDDEYTKLGRYALISHRSFMESFKAKKYSSFHIIARDVDAAVDNIRSAYRDKQFNVVTLAKYSDLALEEGRLIITAMGWISILSSVTGILGMLFIMQLSFKSRRSELSIYNAMGMSKAEVGKMIFLEMFAAGVAGIFTGIISGSLVSLIALPRLIFALQIAMSIHFSEVIILRACLYGLSISIVSAAAGILGLIRGSIWGGLHYE